MSTNSVQPESQGWDLWPMRKWRQFLLDYLQACVGVAPWPVSTFELLRLQGAGSFICQVQLCMLVLKYFHISHQFCSSLGTARLVSSFLSYRWRKFSSGMGIAGMGLHSWAEGGFEPRSPCSVLCVFTRQPLKGGHNPLCFPPTRSHPELWPPPLEGQIWVDTKALGPPSLVPFAVSQVPGSRPGAEVGSQRCQQVKVSSQYLGLAGNKVMASSMPGWWWQLGWFLSLFSGFSSFVLVWKECKNVTSASLKWPSSQILQFAGFHKPTGHVGLKWPQLLACRVGMTAAPSCLGEGNGNLLQYSCLENPTDRGAWQATVHGVTKSQMGLKRLSMHAHTLILRRLLLMKKNQTKRVKSAKMME